MLVVLALILLFGKLMIEGRLPEGPALWLLVGLVLLGSFGGIFRSVAHAFRLGTAPASAAIFYIVLNQTQPELTGDFLQIGGYLLALYIMLYGLARIVGGKFGLRDL